MYKSRSFCNLSQIKKVYIKRLKNRHKEILFHFQNLVTLWRMLTQSFRNITLKCTSRYERTVSKPEYFTYVQSEAVGELIAFLQLRNRVIQLRQSKSWPRLFSYIYWSSQREYNCSPICRSVIRSGKLLEEWIYVKCFKRFKVLHIFLTCSSYIIHFKY